MDDSTPISVPNDEIYCRRLDCSETTYGQEHFCRAHLPWKLCCRSCARCRGTAFAVYGLWAHKDPLVCIEASKEKLRRECASLRELDDELPAWASARAASASHPQKQMHDGHWRAHMNEFAIFKAMVEVWALPSVWDGVSYPAGHEIMGLLRRIIANFNCEQMEKSATAMADEFVTYGGQYLAHHETTDDGTPQFIANRWVSDEIARRQFQLVTHVAYASPFVYARQCCLKPAVAVKKPTPAPTPAPTPWYSKSLAHNRATHDRTAHNRVIYDCTTDNLAAHNPYGRRARRHQGWYYSDEEEDWPG